MFITDESFQGEGEWVFKGAVRKEGLIFHLACYEDAEAQGSLPSPLGAEPPSGPDIPGLGGAFGGGGGGEGAVEHSAGVTPDIAPFVTPEEEPSTSTMVSDADQTGGEGGGGEVVSLLWPVLMPEGLSA